MKNKVIIASCLLLAAARFAFGEVPVSINYVGYLEGVGASGESKELTDKVLLMAFRLYDRPGSGLTSEKKTALWGRQASVSLTDGAFDVDLTDTFGTRLADTRYASLADALSAALDAGTSDIYIGITPASDSNAEIFPRQRLTAVPKALQAKLVRSIPSDFVSTNGVFSTDGELTVTGSSEINAGASYGRAEFAEGAALSFKGGVAVDGTLNADSVSTTSLSAETVAADKANTTGSGTLSVSGQLAAAGTPQWQGALTASATTVTATRVTADVTSAKMETTSLTTDDFVNQSSSTPFCQHSGDWRLVKEWVTDTDGITCVNGESHNFYVYFPHNSQRMLCPSISTGSWEAPCDCLALFQTDLTNLRSDSCACIQFYVVPDATFTSFTDAVPNGAAVLDAGGGNVKLKSTVPLLLRQGQLVKWLCYNDNKATGSKIEETGHTKVTAVRYQPFGW